MTTSSTFESVADVEAQAQRMRDFFATGATMQIDYRRQALVKLKAYLKANEQRALDALAEDLGEVVVRRLRHRTRPRIRGDQYVPEASRSMGAPPSRTHAHRAFLLHVEGLPQPARRGPRALAVELPRSACARADGGCHRRRQLRRAQTLAHIRCHERVPAGDGSQPVSPRIRFRIPPVRAI